MIATVKAGLGTSDCVRCGACCANPPENEAEGFRAWVEVEEDAPLLLRRDLVKKLVAPDERGRLHLRLDAAGRCLALSGTIGQRVTCRIYAHRPHACRRVEPGAADCLRYRAARAIDG